MNWESIINFFRYKNVSWKFRRQMYSFEMCCKIEQAAVFAHMNDLDLKKFNRITEKTKLSQIKLAEARANLVDFKIRQKKRPWSEEFNILLEKYFDGAVPSEISDQLARLFYLYELNRIANFYNVCERVLRQADGDPRILLNLLRQAAIDYRDILS